MKAHNIHKLLNNCANLQSFKEFVWDLEVQSIHRGRVYTKKDSEGDLRIDELKRKFADLTQDAGKSPNRTLYEEVASQLKLLQHLPPYARDIHRKIQGEETKENISEEVALYKHSAELGNREAMVVLANSYMKGEGIPHDEAAARQWLEKAQSKGSAEAAFLLAVMHGSGRGEVKINTDESKRLCIQAAYGGHPPAIEMMARLESKNLFWTTYARATQGHIDAVRQLAEMYEKNSNEIPPLEKGMLETLRRGEAAFEWYKKGAEMGDVDCMRKLSHIYETGRFVRIDSRKARMWTDRANGLR